MRHCSKARRWFGAFWDDDKATAPVGHRDAEGSLSRLAQPLDKRAFLPLALTVFGTSFFLIGEEQILRLLSRVLISLLRCWTFDVEC